MRIDRRVRTLANLLIERKKVFGDYADAVVLHADGEINDNQYQEYIARLDLIYRAGR